MDKNAGFFARQPPHFDELISEALSDFRFSNNLLELGVQEFIATFPVDVGGDRREEEVDEFGEVGFERLLPGRVKIRARVGRSSHENSSCQIEFPFDEEN